MKINDAPSEREWREEGATRGNVEFLQSWRFGEFLKHIGRTVWRLQADGDAARHALQCVIHSLPLGVRFAYVPRANVDSAALPFFLEYLREQGIAFLRIEPTTEIREIPYPRRQTTNRQAQHHWILDVTPEATDLLSGMHPKTRYNIRVAERHGITIDEKKNIDLFWRLDKMTTRRNQYTANPKSYYQALLETEMSYQTNASLGGIPIASAILLHDKDTLIYLFGASSDEFRSTMAPTLLQWYNIRVAKRLGCRYYDFLGVAPAAGGQGTLALHGYAWDASHPFSQVTRFKVGFGGSVRSFPPAEDIILQPLRYLLYRCLKFIGVTRV